MAVGRSQVLKVAITVATVVLATLLFRVLILPQLPPLQLVVSQLFVRLRDALAFLAFTTAIAVGIFSSQQKDGQSNNTRKKPFLEHHPLGSIFGETETAEAMAEEEAHAWAAGSKQMMQMNSSTNQTMVDDSIERAPPSVMIHGSSLQKRSAWLDMEMSRGLELEFPTFITEDCISAPKQKKALHRKSSSLDNSRNYEHEAARVISPDLTPPHSSSGRSKPVKRVSFSHPSLSRDEALDTGGGTQSREQTPAAQQNVASSRSPGDITMQADAFIAKFKEQMRMQRLESLYRRRGGVWIKNDRKTYACKINVQLLQELS